MRGQHLARGRAHEDGRAGAAVDGHRLQRHQRRDATRTSRPSPGCARNTIAASPIGGLCTGAHVLAAAGLLSNKRCAIHWENLPGFSEAFPKANVFADLFEVDQNIYTCAGGTAALDMMLKLIGDDFDENLVNRVCEQVLTDRVRSPTDRQRLPLRARLGVQNSKVLTIIELMEANLSEPLSLIEIADDVGLSRRQIERLFRTEMGRSPARYYLEIRLDRARHLLIQSSHAGGRGRGRLRLRLGLAFLEMLSRALCALAAAGARRPQAVAGGLISALTFSPFAGRRCPKVG